MAGLKRDPRLQELSRDHFYALVLARRARLTAEGELDIPLDALWAEIRQQFEVDLAPHFGVEESTLLPALEAAGERALAARVRAEHAALRAHLEPTSSDDRARLKSFGDLMTHHVRFEENEVFEVAQKVLSDEALEAIDVAAHAYERQRNYPNPRDVRPQNAD